MYTYLVSHTLQNLQTYIFPHFQGYLQTFIKCEKNSKYLLHTQGLV